MLNSLNKINKVKSYNNYRMKLKGLNEILTKEMNEINEPGR